jgi:hypothetical protein
MNTKMVRAFDEYSERRNEKPVPPTHQLQKRLSRRLNAQLLVCELRRNELIDSEGVRWPSTFLIQNEDLAAAIVGQKGHMALPCDENGLQ